MTEVSAHTIYNSLGVQIGYYDTLADLANGVIHYQAAPGKSLTGMALEAPSTWQMNCGFFAQRKPVYQCLLSQGIYPNWDYPNSDTAQADATASNTPFSWADLTSPIDLSGIGLDFSGTGVGSNPFDTTGIKTLALYGGLGLLGIFVASKVISKALD